LCRPFISFEFLKQTREFGDVTPTSEANQIVGTFVSNACSMKKSKSEVFCNFGFHFGKKNDGEAAEYCFSLTMNR
jgi:hypothetical protein